MEIMVAGGVIDVGRGVSPSTDEGQPYCGVSSVIGGISGTEIRTHSELFIFKVFLSFSDF